MEENLITGIIYSKFDPKIGPKAVACVPFDLSDKIKELISLKALNIFAGEKGAVPKSLAIMPFPSHELKGLTKCIRIMDNTQRGGVIESAITLIFNERNDIIFYKYINNFEVIFDEVANKIINLEESKADKNQILEEINGLYKNLINILEELHNKEILIKEAEAIPKKNKKETKLKIYRFKIIVCGDITVGKTSIVMQFTDNAFRRSYMPTIGVNVCEKQIRYKDAKIEFLIWDIAGHSKFEIMRKHFYGDADGVLLVFDLTNPQSFQNIPYWYQDVKKYLKNDIHGIILGNKKDLLGEGKINEEEILKLANEIGFTYLETSALTGENVNEAFYKMGEILYNIK